jgi:uncharacterized membrane protein
MSAEPTRRTSEDDGNLAPAPTDGLAAIERGDFRLEQRLGRILGIGVHVSTLCLAIGLFLSLGMSRAAIGDPLMIAGIVALMATPVARVAASVVDYGLRRDWTFFLLTLIVLVELCAGVVAALVYHRRL